MITIAINENRIASTLGRCFCGDASTQVVVEGTPADGLRVALIDPARKVLALCNEFTASGTNAVGTIALNTQELADALVDVPTGRTQRIAIVIYTSQDITLGSGFVPVVANPLPSEITPIPQGETYLKLADCLGSISATSDYPVQSKAIASELNNIRANQFGIAVNGVAVPPLDGVVNVPTNYAFYDVVEVDTAYTLRPNCINYVLGQSGIDIQVSPNSSASSVLDYLLLIDVAEGVSGITFSNESDYPFVSPNADAFSLEVGTNLLSFTILPNATIAVNRVLLKEVS